MPQAKSLPTKNHTAQQADPLARLLAHGARCAQSDRVRRWCRRLLQASSGTAGKEAAR
jgi:hypothetical protein